MTSTTKQSVALFLIVAVVVFVAWRLWPDGGRARQEQRNFNLMRAVSQEHLADATRLLNDGADPNAQEPALSFTDKARLYYSFHSEGLKAPSWNQMDEIGSHFSPLETAVMRGNADMVGLLLSRGADAGYHDRERRTAMGWAKLLRRMPRKDGGHLRVLALLKAAEAQKKGPPTPGPSHPNETPASGRGE